MTAAKVLRYELQDLRRSRWLVGYALLLLVLTDALLRFGGGGPRAVLSLMNVVLVFVPLVSIVFGTMYLYGARDFIELLLAQPVGRGSLFAGLYAGLAAPLALGFLLGVGLPFLWGGQGEGSLAGPLAMLLAPVKGLTAIELFGPKSTDNRYSVEQFYDAMALHMLCAVKLCRIDWLRAPAAPAAHAPTSG